MQQNHCDCNAFPRIPWLNISSCAGVCCPGISSSVEHPSSLFMLSSSAHFPIGFLLITTDVLRVLYIFQIVSILNAPLEKFSPVWACLLPPETVCRGKFLIVVCLFIFCCFMKSGFKSDLFMFSRYRDSPEIFLSEIHTKIKLLQFQFYL